MPVEARHFVVGDEQIVVLLLKRFPCLSPSAGGIHVEAGAGEKQCDMSWRMSSLSSATRILRTRAGTGADEESVAHERIETLQVLGVV